MGKGWASYFLSGYKAILDINEKWAKAVPKPKGLKILVDSRIPTASGLSSSSAFTVCVSLVTLHANGLSN